MNYRTNGKVLKYHPRDAYDRQTRPPDSSALNAIRDTRILHRIMPGSRDRPDNQENKPSSTAKRHELIKKALVELMLFIELGKDTERLDLTIEQLCLQKEEIADD